MKYPAVLMFLLVNVYFVSAYPTGAPKCTSLTPKHSGTKAQTGKAPFKVEASAPTKKDGKSSVTVTISGIDSAKFKGFLLYATAADGSDKIGTFAKTDKTKLVTCDSTVSCLFNVNLPTSLIIIFVSIECHHSF